MLFVKVDDLKPGMRLGKPIYNKNGVLLYDRDTRLTLQAIYGIKNFNLMGLYILEPAELGSGHKAVLSMMLAHEQGVLSALLAKISEAGGSVLTITQSLPIRGKASVTLSLEINSMTGSMTELINAMENTPGTEQVRLLAVE